MNKVCLAKNAQMFRNASASDLEPNGEVSRRGFTRDQPLQNCAARLVRNSEKRATISARSRQVFTSHVLALCLSSTMLLRLLLRIVESGHRLPMVRLTVVPIIALALSEATKAATLAVSASVMTRLGWLMSAR